MKKLFLISMVAMAVLSHAQQGGGRQMGGRGGNSMTGLLNRADVQTELKLSADQKSKLTELMPQRGQRNGGGGGGGNAGGGGGGNAGAGGGQGNFDPAQMRQQMAEREKKILEILNADQAKRLKELYVQRAGNQALTREDIQKELGFSADQTKKVSDLQQAQRDAMQELRQKMQNQEIDRDQMREISQKNNETMNTELGKVLTAEQAAKFKAMRGAEFKFEDNNGG